MADSSPIAPAKSHAKKQKDDKDHFKSKLGDAAFNPSRYPDPLEARPSPDPKSNMAEGVTAGMTERWLDMIKEARERTASSS